MIYLKRNLPIWERVLRLALAAVVVALGQVLGPEGLWTWLAWGAGLMLAGTAAVGFCPACALLGRCSVKARS